MPLTIKQLRAYLRKNVGVVNPYDLLQIALEFLVNTDLEPESAYVCVNQMWEGLQVWAGHKAKSLDGRLVTEVKSVEVHILQDPELWRLSKMFLQWEQKTSEGFDWS